MRQRMNLVNLELMPIHRGLGTVIVEKFAAEGCNVAINYNASRESAEILKEKIEKHHGVKAVTIQGVHSFISCLV